MIYRFDSFWSYIGNEPQHVIDSIKEDLTRQDYDFQEEAYNTVTLYQTHSNILGYETIRFPTGLCNYLSNKYNLEVEWKRKDYKQYTEDDVREIGAKIRHLDPDFEIRDYQIEGVLASAHNYQSLIMHVTGAGKTTTLSLLCLLLSDKKIMIQNNINFILKQIYDRLISVGVPESDIGIGTTDLSKRIVIINSATSYNRIKDQDQEYINYLKQVEVLIIDECAHFQSISFFSPLFFMDSLRNVVGYSGSPFRNKSYPHDTSTDLVTVALLGEPVSTYLYDDAISENKIAQSYAYFINYQPTPSYLSDKTDYFIQYKVSIVRNKLRNKAGIEILKYLDRNGIKTLALFREVKHHGLPILKQLKQDGVKALFIQGGEKIHEYDGKLKLKSRKGDIEDVKLALEKDYNIILGSSVMDEGIDINCFQAGVLFGGGKAEIKMTQQQGRVSRTKKSGENIALIVDFKDININGMFYNQYISRRNTLKVNSAIELDNVQKLFEIVERMKNGPK